MRTKPPTLLALAAAGLATALSLSGCFGAPANSEGPGGGADSTPTATAAVTPTPCQVSPAELFIYLQGDKAKFAEAGSPAALSDLVCVSNFAAAKIEAKAGASAATEYVLFSQNVQNGHWTVLAVGASGICAGKAPDAVAAVLPGCSAA